MGRRVVVAALSTFAFGGIAAAQSEHTQVWYTTGSHAVRGLDAVTSQEVAAFEGITTLTGISFGTRDRLVAVNNDGGGAVRSIINNPLTNQWSVTAPYTHAFSFANWQNPAGPFAISGGRQAMVVDRTLHAITIVPTQASPGVEPLIARRLDQEGGSAFLFPREVAQLPSSALVIAAGFNLYIQDPSSNGLAGPMFNHQGLSGFGIELRGRIANFETPEGTKKVWHPFIYAAADAGIFRYDGFDRTRWGKDETNPTGNALFIDTAALGIKVNDIAKAEDGYLYGIGRDAANVTQIFRWTSDGTAAGVTPGNPAYYAVPGDGGNHIAVWPGVQRTTATQSGSFTATADSAFFPHSEQDIFMNAAAGVAATVTLENGTKMTGRLEIGGAGSGQFKLRLADGHALTLGDAKLLSNGTLELNNATTGIAALATDGGGTIDVNGGTLALESLNLNGGQILSQNGAQVTGLGEMVAAGAGNMVAAGAGNIVAAGAGNMVAAGAGNIVAAGGGNIVAAGAGNIVAAGGGNIVAAGGGNIVAAGGGNIVAAGAGNLQGGSASLDALPVAASLESAIAGVGTFTAPQVQLNAGTALRPGDTLSATTNALVAGAGLMNIHGALTLDAGARTAVDLGTAVSDKVVVTGSAIIGGTLSVSWAPGDVALPGQSIEVLTFGSRTGAFASIANNTGRAGLTITPLYDDDSLTLVLSGRGGDADLDGSVNFADLLALARHYNQATGQRWLEGDFTGDGAVGFNDLLVLARNYGTSGANTQSTVSEEAFAADWALAQSIVPEPAVAMVSTCAGLVAAGRRRARR